MTRIQDLININERKGLPRTYRFNPFLRWFSILLALAVSAYSIWVILYKVNRDSSTFYKIIPFVIMFLALNTLLRNLLSVNAIRLRSDRIGFHYIAKPSVTIEFNSLKELSLHDTRPRGIKFSYQKGQVEKSFLLLLSFPKIIEIVNSIAELCPDLIYDEFLQNVIITDLEKKTAQKQ